MSTIEVTVPDDLLRLIDERARARGSDRGQVIRDIVDRELREGGRAPINTFDEVLAPIREGFAESGMSEEETRKLLESELRAVRAERRAGRRVPGGR
jgi:hypothetical protein